MERLAAIVVLGMLAGCMAPAADVETTSTEETPSSPLMEKLGAEPARRVDPSPAAAPGAATAAPPLPNGTWYVATVLAGPDTGLSAFDWTVPAGAVVPWGYAEDFDSDLKVIPLEIALLTEGAALPSTWGFVAFEENDGLVLPSDGFASIPTTVTVTDPLVPLAGTLVVAESEPTSTAFVTMSEHAEGSTLRIVLLAQTESPREVGLAFRVLDHDPYYSDSEEEPAASADAFLAARNGTRPTALPARAIGTGFAAHAYSETSIGGFPAGPGWEIEFVTGEPSYAWNVPPEARALPGVHTLTASVTSGIPHGFDIVGADYVSLAIGASRYAATVSIQGESDSVSGLDVEAWPLLFAPAGVFFFAGGGILGSGDGDAESSAALTVERAQVPGLMSASSVALLEFGATVEELTGKPAAPAILKGDYGGLPPSLDLARGPSFRLPGGGVLQLSAPAPQP